MADADELGRFGVARQATAVAERLPPLPVLGVGLLLVGLALLAVGSLLSVTPVAVLGGLVALPGAVVLVLGFRRSALDVDAQ